VTPYQFPTMATSRTSLSLSLSQRLLTFKEWTGPQTAEFLADCGFYWDPFLGGVKCINCAHCGLVLYEDQMQGELIKEHKDSLCCGYFKKSVCNHLNDCKRCQDVVKLILNFNKNL
jgi:Inhibitor of Apoptosis domain